MAVPNPRTWEPGDQVANTPTAAILNDEWKGAMDWALGITRPFAVLNGNGGSVATNNAWVPTFFSGTSDVVRGGITHNPASNSSRVTVPDTGTYRGIVTMGFTGMQTTGAGRMLYAIRKNADATENNFLDRYNPALNDGVTVHAMTWEFAIDLVAGDYFEVIFFNAHSATNPVQATDNKKPRMIVWLDTAP